MPHQALALILLKTRSRIAAHRAHCEKSPGTLGTGEGSLFRLADIKLGAALRLGMPVESRKKLASRTQAI